MSYVMQEMSEDLKQHVSVTFSERLRGDNPVGLVIDGEVRGAVGVG